MVVVVVSMYHGYGVWSGCSVVSGVVVGVVVVLAHHGYVVWCSGGGIFGGDVHMGYLVSRVFYYVSTH